MRKRAARPPKPRVYVHHLVLLLTLCASVSSSRSISSSVPPPVRASADHHPPAATTATAASTAAATTAATAATAAATAAVATAGAARGEPLLCPVPVSLVAFVKLPSILRWRSSSLTRRGYSTQLIPRPLFTSTPKTALRKWEWGGPPFLGASRGLSACRLSTLGGEVAVGKSACNLSSAAPVGSPINSSQKGYLALCMRAHIHRNHSRLGRPQAHRKALLRNLATQLVRYGSITTTAPRARELCRVIDNKLLLAKKGGIHNYRQALGFFYDKQLTRQLFREAPQRFARRNSGFCRRVRLPFPRLGDAAKMCRVDLID
ncbi:hypothetical protein Esti_000365 [Eimeria stiedai]